MQLLSRIDMGEVASFALRSADHVENDTMHAVSATPRPQPELSPTYTLVNASKKPSPMRMRPGRTVSRAASPRKARSYHSASPSASTSATVSSRGLLASISSGSAAGFWKRGMVGGRSADRVDEQAALAPPIVENPPAIGLAAHGPLDRGDCRQDGGGVAPLPPELPPQILSV